MLSVGWYTYYVDKCNLKSIQKKSKFVEIGKKQVYSYIKFGTK